MIRFIFSSLSLRTAVLFAFLRFLSSLHAAESAPSACGLSVLVTGEIAHSTPKPNLRVEGASQPDYYIEEIYGKNFTASVSGLPEGRYTVEIYFAETFHRSAGRRVFDVACGKQKLAEGLDLFALAGINREYVLRATVDHLEDVIGGPLALQFEARRDNAIFNAIVIKNSAGQPVSCVKARDLAELSDPAASVIPDIREPAIYGDPSEPLEKRVADLVRRLSLKEKVAQLMNNAPPVERLGVPGYEYWNECLHGVGLAGHATVFPQAIGLASAWDPAALRTIADVIATEGRAKNNEAREKNPNTRRFYGLTFWTPNINIFRDPRWGRGQETYGEDPFLTARLGVAFICGLQGDDPRYLKVMACAKHFAVHSGPEKTRHVFNATPPVRDVYETYLPQFEAAVREGKVGQVMSVYNRIDGIPGPVHKFLLNDLLRDQWGFDGYVVSDCGGVRDVWQNHKYVRTAAEASALSIRAGNDLECGSAFSSLAGAVNQSLVTEREIDVALTRVLAARFKLGLFDTPEQCAYLLIPASANNAPAHRELATEAARASMVLLKNDGLLPLDRAKIRRIALIGPNAASTRVLLGNYYGDPLDPVSLEQGLREVAGSGIDIVAAPGCPLALPPGQALSADTPEAQAALDAARAADVVIFAGGMDGSIEGEEMKTSYEGFDRGDRTRIELPAHQTALLQALAATGKPVVLVNFSGGAVALPWEAENLPAILQAWYPGQSGGRAVADVLFGDYNPAGRLPVTFYQSTADLPDFNEYAMANRTYRYFGGKVLYPFGHGLSYTTFAYSQSVASALALAPDGAVTVSVDVKNTGARDGAEVVQAYVKHLAPATPQPIHSLAAFQRVEIARGQVATVRLTIPASALRYWDVVSSRYVVPEGPVEVQIGASSADIRSTVRLQIGR